MVKNLRCIEVLRSSSDSGDRRDGRADRAGQVQRRRRQEEAAALVLPQPGGEVAQEPQFAEMDAVLEQAMLVQRQQRVGRSAVRRLRHQLDGEIVGDQRGDAGVGDPRQEPLVAAVEAGAGALEDRGSGSPRMPRIRSSSPV